VPNDPQRYDAIAGAYDLRTAGHPHEAWLLRVEALALAHGLAGRRVLDVACGTGKRLAPLLQRGYVVIAWDASSAMVARARARAGGRAKVVVADVRHLPVLGAFDLVTCLGDVLCHLLTAQDALAALEGSGAISRPATSRCPRPVRRPPDAIAGDDRHVVLCAGLGEARHRTAMFVVSRR
jgi:SAM-dependent methyltransferase